MNFVQAMKEKALRKELLSQEEALKLYKEPIKPLCSAANEIRQHFCGNVFDICTITNAKSGRCSENCKYCAQSAYYHTQCVEYSLVSQEKILEEAVYNANRGILRYSLVTSGKSLSDEEVEYLCKVAQTIKKETPLSICGSFGLLNEEQFRQLYQAGLTRIHNNLETSRQNFSNVCTTHTFQEKVDAIEMAKAAGMAICSGGIFGIGESIQDRIDLAFSLKELGVKSVPINLLNPVKGTPYENNKPLCANELCRIVAVFRFILPEAFLRLAGGRGLLLDRGKSCFQAGANAAISGDMLTTAGISIDTDMKMVHALGFEVTLKTM